ncbi:MAG: Mpo1-like protein [Pseudobdellovibrionaceae bacterium]
MNCEFRDFREFYKFYLAQHSNRNCLRLHFAGTSLFFVTTAFALSAQIWFLIPLAVAIGYLFAWSGHFFFEKNRPATFQRIFWSARAGRMMYFQLLTGKLPLK